MPVAHGIARRILLVLIGTLCLLSLLGCGAITVPTLDGREVTPREYKIELRTLADSYHETLDNWRSAARTDVPLEDLVAAKDRFEVACRELVAFAPVLSAAAKTESWPLDDDEYVNDLTVDEGNVEQLLNCPDENLRELIELLAAF